MVGGFRNVADPLDKARDEFFAEVQELIEALAASLLALDESERAGSLDPDRLNEAFRAVHTLKGLAGLFGATGLSGLTHELEEVLDALRLGRLSLTQGLLDSLFRATEELGRALAAEKTGEAPPEVDDLLRELASAVGRPAIQESPLEEYVLDPGLLAVLTEYEEHRLHACIQAGLDLFRLRATLELQSLDRELEALKRRAKPVAEVITYLPTGTVSDPELIELDLLLASSEDEATLRRDVAQDAGELTRVERRVAPHETRATIPPPPLLSTDFFESAHATEPPESANPPARGAQLRRAEPGSELAESVRAVTQTVRVDIRRLDHLMNIVGELALMRSSLSRLGERLRIEGQRGTTTDLLRLQRSFERRLTELQDGILEVRMVPLGQVFDRLARAVRQLGRQLQKDIRLVITGAETEIDKLLVEELSDPLLHMVRNAIDHGIESADERQRVGKPASGTIALNAFQKGNHVIIEIEDDGAGIDTDALVKRAVSDGRLGAENAAELSTTEAVRLIFVPGLSTSRGADDLSGRGVGMDVVKTNIAKLGGVVDVHSELGIGAKLTVTLPITLAIVSALMVQVAGQTYAVPLSNVSEAMPLVPGETRTVENREIMNLRGSTLPLCRVGQLFDVPTRPPDKRGGVEPARANQGGFVVVATVGARKLGLVVDTLLGQRDIVIKSLGASLKDVRGFSGAAELEERHVALVMDVAALIDEVVTGVDPPKAGIRELGYG